MIQIYPGAEPFYFTGNSEIAILFIHGFTASPSEIYQVGRMVHEKTNATVSGILLPGHGSHPRFLNRTDWQEWYASVADETAYLLKNYEEVYIAGLSLGGLLAINAGLNFNNLRGVIAINPPLKLKFPIAQMLAPLLKGMIPYVPKPKGEHNKLWGLGRFAYDKIPLRAFCSLMQLQDKILQDLENLDSPLLLIQSLADETVNYKGIYEVKSRMKTPVSLVELEDLSHVVTIGNSASLVAGHILDFIRNGDNIEKEDFDE
ncbi:MAG: alpha/beta fold hydrolase [Syntrophomonadaceae bacterium]|nr:alpha/beta fold hydrolase [Syntrophomonadaceae bacterium]